jgi:predicted signal transduction protein with EAL and GGDEF domain
MTDNDKKNNILSLAAGSSRQPSSQPEADEVKTGEPKVIVMDSADFVGVGQMRQELLEQAVDGKPRLMLLERSELAELRAQLDANPAVDFLLKPVDYDALQARIDKLVATVSELTERKHQLERVQAQVDRLVYYDRLTALPNNEFFRRHLEFQIRHAQRYGRQLAVLAVDLQSFERVDRLHGQPGVEKLLAQSGKRMVRATRDYDLVGQVPQVMPFTEERMITRVDGDRFLLLLSEFHQVKDISTIVERLVQVLKAPIEVDGQEIVPRPKVGISVYPSDGSDENALIRNAHAALEFSESHQLGHYGFFAQSMNQMVYDRFSMEGRLRDAVDQQAFEVVYQPKVEISSGQTRGFEALLRWRDSELGSVSPRKFIPLAEELGLIHDISRWVLNEVCAQSRRWEMAGIAPLPISVNLSGQDFLRSDFPDFVTGVLLDHGMSPENLELEITEHGVMQNIDKAAPMLAELRRIGISIALDDFGPGISSLGNLHRISIDTLKIDRSFIRNITNDWNSAAITSGMITLSHVLNLNVVAEGVETQEQQDILAEQGCNQIQGALYGMPMTPEVVARWVRG